MTSCYSDYVTTSKSTKDAYWGTNSEYQNNDTTKIMSMNRIEVLSKCF